MIVWIVAGAAVVCFYIGFRAPSVRILFFSAMAWIKGVPILWIDDPHVAARVLKASGTKGIFLERILSEPAWLPVISLESIDDPLWTSMKKNLTILMKALPSSMDLEKITKEIALNHLKSCHVFDSNSVVYITIAAFYKWIFQEPFPDNATFVCDATWEWRKELAIKGKANVELKKRVVQWVIKEIEATPWLYVLFGDKWCEPEYYSLMLQPFFLSPGINVSDVAVTIKALCNRQKDKEYDVVDMITKALDMAHPFVILERFLKNGLPEDGIAPGTHVFIPMDMMTSDNTIRFGGGSRKCPGQQQAMAIMTGLFQPEILNSTKFQPHQGHLYSGRDQDGKETLPELLYQVYVIVTVFWTAIWQKIS
ncbi:hypothetical protein THRCLA_10493 [Thraustotheca clavata]|uniref:Cytochrome P450 n=1 Tax=Thraustotheca clavata TaxID=74557 RepID=A0A1V9YN69_9STRA|nr:hypothetical protein THRCLA_10493 [Thraustotheca clavata]